MSDLHLRTPPARPRGGAPNERALAGGRARDTAPMPPSTLTGYEQILAARAAMRAQAERISAAEQFAPAAASPAAPARRRRGQSRRGARLRRFGLIASGLAAVPACVLLALAWVGTQHPQVAPPDGAAPSIRASLPRSAASAAARIPKGESALAASDQEAAPWAAGTEAPQGSALSDVALDRANDEPALLLAEGDEPMVAARDRGAPPRAVDAEPEGPRESGSRGSEPSRAEEEPAPPAAAVAATMESGDLAAEAIARTRSDDAPPAVPVIAGPAAPLAEGQTAPAPSFAEAPGQEPQPVALPASAFPGEDAPPPPAARVAAPADAAPVAPDAMLFAGAAADAVPAGAGGSAAPPPPRQVAVAVPPPPFPADRAPAKVRTVGPPPRTARATGNDAPSARARCQGIVMQAQLGEETSHADRAYLRTACGARR